ncbi:MAG: HAD-IIB family hydrolase [Lachnospiraceae bacterium]|nr:HAD-IIB family hydrolase [Lachnospiraceae bacterium]
MDQQKKPKTLYVTDLDGTLLHSDEMISEYSARRLNELAQDGMLFSYATARSIYSAKKVTAGLNVSIPLILYNGVCIMDNSTRNLLTQCDFGADAPKILEKLLAADIYPVVYSFIEGRERFSYHTTLSNAPVMDFGASRTDERKRPVDSVEALAAGNIFYFTCIDRKEKLLPLYEYYKDTYSCYYSTDMYSGEQWLEIVPKVASKARAALQLKEMLGAERLVVFGDQVNDIPLFSVADEAYAVGNAVPELKALATGVIGTNDEDAVVHWLEEEWEREKQNGKSEG